MKKILLALLMTMMVVTVVTTPAFGQAAYLVDRDTAVIKTSGGTFTHQNRIGELSIAFELLFNGSPTTSTVTIQGCGRGNVVAYAGPGVVGTTGANGQPTQAATCDTLDTYTANANAVRKVNGFYDNYVVTFTFSGGTNPTLQINETGSAASSPLSPNDPCQSSAFAKQSVPVNISSATTTQLVALSAGLRIYVCGVYASAAGTSPTMQFEYGTGSTCGTGTTLLTGTIAASTTVPLALETGLTNFSAPQGNALCAISGGTGPSFQGLLTFVQAP